MTSQECRRCCDDVCAFGRVTDNSGTVHADKLGLELVIVRWQKKYSVVCDVKFG